MYVNFLYTTISHFNHLPLKGKQEIDHTHGGKKWVARCDSFGKFLDLFGPLDNQTLSQVVPLSFPFFKITSLADKLQFF